MNDEFYEFSWRRLFRMLLIIAIVATTVTLSLWYVYPQP